MPVATPGQDITLLAWAATPPVFDGPEDLSGLRNADELAVWQRLLDGAWGPPPPTPVLLGDAQLDPLDGEACARRWPRSWPIRASRTPRPVATGPPGFRQRRGG